MPIQDTIQLSLSAEETVVNDTVRITATLSGMISPNDDEDAFRDSIRSLLQRFIKAEWQYANQIRRPHASGDEEITLTATTRVDEEENQALDRRRQEASRDHAGRISITSVSADTSPSSEQVVKTQRALRVSLLKQAQDELKIINETMGEKYRIGTVIFQPVEPFTISNRPQARAASLALAADAPGGAAPLGNAVKLMMTADIIYSISPKLRR